MRTEARRPHLSNDTCARFTQMNVAQGGAIERIGKKVLNGTVHTFQNESIRDVCLVPCVGYKVQIVSLTTSMPVFPYALYPPPTSTTVLPGIYACV